MMKGGLWAIAQHFPGLVLSDPVHCSPNCPVTQSDSLQSYRAQIHVTLRPSVLDPAGVAVESSLHQLGYDTVAGVRIGKYVELTVAATDVEAAREQVDQMCDRLLANPVIENYAITLEPAPTPAVTP